jgi:hypothetical protein
LRHLQSILLGLFWKWGLEKYFPGLASNLDPPVLSLPSSWDYRREPPEQGKIRKGLKKIETQGQKVDWSCQSYLFRRDGAQQCSPLPGLGSTPSRSWGQFSFF